MKLDNQSFEIGHKLREAVSYNRRFCHIFGGSFELKIAQCLRGSGDIR